MNFNKTSIMLFSILTFILLSACTKTSINNSPVSEPSVGNTQPVSTNAPIPDVGPGMYKVGIDVQPGEYLIVAPNGDGYWAILKDSTNQIESIINNENISTFDYVQIKDGEYLSLINSYAILREKYKQPIVTDYISDGTYKIGADIPAGEYKLIPVENSAYWERSRDRRGIYSIIANDIISGPAYVTVKEGEYFHIVGIEADLP